MLGPLLSALRWPDAIRRFAGNRRGSAAVQFAMVAPIFFALIFAIIETAMVFFAGQVLETGVQDSGRLIYTNQAKNLTQEQFRQDLCNRVAALFTCANIVTDVKSYGAGDVIPTALPIDSAGQMMSNFSYQIPAAGSADTVVVRAFYQWPIFVTKFGYDIANIGRGTDNSKRLLVATAAFRVEP